MPDRPSTSSSLSTPSPPPLLSLFSHDRFRSSSVLFLLWVPLGVIVFTLRLFIGVHAFVIACVLRKANLLRGLVLRVMCALCGIVVTSSNKPEPSVRLVVANHITYLDHLAVDLIHPCVLASVWDIPNLLRWCFGYVDLGARVGRRELIKQAKQFTECGELPLLSFPESALTSGKVGLLRFATWPFEVSESVQPVSMRVSRPFFPVECSVLGGTWWQDLAFFLFLPATIINVKFLPAVVKEVEETPEQFALRVSNKVAADLGIAVTEYTSHDAVEAAKKHLRAREAAAAKPRPRVRLSPRKLDEAAMLIKQTHPSIPVADIRRDLEITNDPRLTIERIKTGQLKPTALVVTKKATSSYSDPSEWRKLFNERKWQLIENNRAKYLERATDQ